MFLAQALADSSLATTTTFLSVMLVSLLLAKGLHRFYPVFFCYWIYDILLAMLVFLPLKRQLFGEVRITCLALRWILYFLVVLELIDRILAEHPGIARLGKRVVQIVLVCSAAGAIYALRESSSQGSLGLQLHLYFQLEQAVAGCLLLFLVGISVFLWLFPVRLNRNTKAYLAGFTVFFLVKALGPFLINEHGAGFRYQASAIHMTGVLLCQVMWLFAITKRGAERSPPFTRNWTASEQQQALSTLDAFEQQISGRQVR